MCTFDRIIKADICVVIISADFSGIGNITEVTVFRRCNDINGNKFLRFLNGFPGPYAGIHICSFSRMNSQIHRYHGKLRRTATLKKQNLIGIRNVHQPPDKRFRILDNRFEGRRTVTHFHHRLSASLIICHFSCSFFQNFFRKTGWSGRKIINPTHYNPLIL